MLVVRAIVVFFVVAFLYACLGSWFVMVGMGNLHDVWNTVPALGFWEVLSFTVWFGAFASLYTANRESSS
jgi:ABC-type Fe3+ transport system permease subunit